ncbi:MAG: hypothetical protein CMC89_02980 [Flavobacteriaceae bacterium]|nr:hypothetical protein [Flavobacteriaceae bacterium]|tara:strand:- start:726 stop:2114 length:1389 start_codon:yes stop_codon:yes gene_type:complete
MAQTIKIKRSSSNATPTSLDSGELAYSFKSDSKKLFIGDASNNVLPIGGQAFTEKLDLIGAPNGSAAADTRVVASPANLGVIRIGSGLSIASNGVVSANNQVTTSAVASAGALMTTGGTMTGDLQFGDDTDSGQLRIKMGASDDLQMYHHITSGSFLREVGTGDLFIQSDGAGIRMRIEDSGSNLLQIHATATETKLGYAGNTKLTTKTGGVEISGSVVATGLDINGNADISGTTILGDDVTFTGASGNIVFDKSDDSLEFADDVKASFGASGDLKIFHDGTSSPNASMIEESGAGNLIIKGSNLEVRSSTDELYAQFVQDSVSKLYCDNAQKLSTKSDGVLITGELQSTTLDVNGDADISGDLILGGDLKITGDINQQNISVTDLDVTDKTITVGVGQTAADSSNSGITVDGANAKIVYEYDTSSSSGKFEMDQGTGSQAAILTAANWGTEYTGAVDGGQF